MTKKLIILLFVVALMSVSYAEVVIGDWEQNDDDWILPPDAEYEPAIGVTLNEWSLHLQQDGYGQVFSIKLQDAGHIADFLANDTFLIDYSVAASTAGGWNEIYDISLNAEGYGWQDQNISVHYDFWDGSPERTTTVEMDYSEVFDMLTVPPSYVEIIFALNSGDGQVDFYFDNARLTPEPATLALLGLGGLLLRRRR